MANRLVYLLFFCFVARLVPASVQPNKTTGTDMMTEQRALSLLHSRGACAPDAGLVVIHKIEPDASTKKVAAESLAEARTKHFNLYHNGVLANVLRAGGYVVLEFDKRTDQATRLHLITLDEAGRPQFDCESVEGDLSRSDALMIIKRNEEFSDAVLRSPFSPITETWRKFGGTHVEITPDKDLDHWPGLPERLTKISVGPDELMDLLSLASAFELWRVRYGLTLPIYAAYLPEADRRAERKLQEIIHEEKVRSLFTDFPEGKRRELNCSFGAIATREELTGCIQGLKAFNSLLDARFASQLQSATYKANLLFSRIPQGLVVGEDSRRAYTITTATCLVTVWSRGKNSEFVLVDLSLSQEQD